VARRRGEDPLEELHRARAEGVPLRPPGRGPTERFKAGGLWLLAGLGLLVAVRIVVEQGQEPFPVLAPSCTTPALKLAPAAVKPRDEVRFSLAVPDGVVRLAIDTTAIDAAGVATPSEPDAVTQVFEELEVFDCLVRDEFPAAVPVGDHVVTAFRLVDGRWTAAASAALVVR
jgi:hypothetical protein